MAEVVPQSPFFDVTNDFKKRPRVYIKNLHFGTAEEELEDFLLKYDP